MRGRAWRAGAQRPDRRRAPAGPGLLLPAHRARPSVDHSMRIMREETFGPVLPIMAVRFPRRGDPPGQRQRLRPHRQRLDARARRPRAGSSSELAAGVVTINDCVSSFGEPTAPWGGIKQSGIGRTHGLAGPARDGAGRSTSREDRSRGPALWWYPYGEDYRRLMRHREPRAPLALPLRAHRRPARLRRASRRFWRRVSLVEPPPQPRQAALEPRSCRFPAPSSRPPSGPSGPRHPWGSASSWWRSR